MIKVLIERKVKPGKEKELFDLLRQARASATLYPGYISGETLSSKDESGVILVIATFKSLEAWKEWQNNSQRLGIISKMDALLAEPPKVKVYEFI